MSKKEIQSVSWRRFFGLLGVSVGAFALATFVPMTLVADERDSHPVDISTSNLCANEPLYYVMYEPLNRNDILTLYGLQPEKDVLYYKCLCDDETREKRYTNGTVYLFKDEKGEQVAKLTSMEPLFFFDKAILNGSQDQLEHAFLRIADLHDKLCKEK